MAKPARELPSFHRLPPVRPGARSKQHQIAGDNVGASKLARHLDLTHPRIHQLVDEHVLERLPNGKFDLDDSRVRYIRWLRAPERRAQKGEVDQAFTAAKTELISIRVQEKKRALIEREEALEVMDRAISTTLVALGGLAARVAGSDLQLRRKIDQVVFEVRVALANQLNELADQRGEPPADAPTTDDTEKTEAG